MKIFEKFSRDQISKLRQDTSNFFIGAPEAEAESTHSSKIQLNEIFEDFFDVLPKLQTEKFIISGRKGNGKTAIAEHIHYLCNNEHDYFCDFIRKADIDIEKITQLTKESDIGVSQELLIEWIILINIVKQLVKNQGIENQREINDLNVFLRKNSGFVEIKSNQIEEVIQSKGWEINVEYFRRYLTAKFGNKFDIKSGKAPFYKLIPHLKETVRELFKNTINRDNHYILIFDDLDIGFNTTNKNNIKTILNIIRVVKDYNISFFGKEGISAKIILLLREDISRVLLNEDADTAKIFSSYEIPLNWYEHQRIYKQENQLKLKQFINKRIALNFTQNGLAFNEVDPWSSLISDDEGYSKSSFKYVIDHTLLRPRDLILFFKPLPELKFSIPLNKSDINTLLGKYSVEFVKELRNELTAHYSSENINSIFNAFNNCVQEPVSYKYFIDELNKFGFNENVDSLLNLLFDLSIIGNVTEDNKTYFKHWEQDDEIFHFNHDFKIIPHFTLRNYCQRRR